MSAKGSAKGDRKPCVRSTLRAFMAEGACHLFQVSAIAVTSTREGVEILPQRLIMAAILAECLRGSPA
jgi:hypothetical protein